LECKIYSYQQSHEAGKLARFFKSDLKPIHYLGFGLKYKILQNRLEFYGTPISDILGQIIIQITNLKGLMLKELVIDGKVSRIILPTKMIKYQREETMRTNKMRDLIYQNLMR
jgi:hypothetical protein